ncbi:hypothetical protein MNBD_GAMMA11-1432 [hydrothermal vent metagenome]|uniref:Uncharacterized protein n=1 Tax=hydrothermal vent metagenome TaxID=652676 RepID=A0A3B0WRF8_9ZZZZ
MASSVASINSSLVNLKTTNSTLLIKLKQLGFNTELTLGSEKEYTVKTLIQAIDTLAIQFLTITANSRQFIQRTSYAERRTIETCLRELHTCLLQTQQDLQTFHPLTFHCHAAHALIYTDEKGEYHCLKLLDAAQYIDTIKPYYRMLETITAHERIHALSAVLENMLNRDTEIIDSEIDLTDEQTNALQLSQYLIRQAL